MSGVGLGDDIKPPVRLSTQYLRAGFRCVAGRLGEHAGDGPEVLVSQIERIGLKTTDYSPELKPAKGVPPHVFALRTYTCPSPEKLLFLHERFRTTP